MRIFFFLCMLSVFMTPLSAQTEIPKKDSLLVELSKIKEDSAKIIILNRLANLYVDNDLLTCLSYVKEMELLLDKLPGNTFVEAQYSTVAFLYLGCNVYDKAYELFFKSLNISERLGHEQEICITNGNIGGVYLRLFKYEEALERFKKCLDMSNILLQKGNVYFKTHQYAIYNNVGLAYGKLKKTSVAITYIEKAIEMVPSENFWGLAQYHWNLAPLYYEVGERAKAFDCISKARGYWAKVNNQTGIAYCCYTQASFYLMEKELRLAGALLSEGLEIAVKMKSNVLQRDIYTLLVKLYKEEKNYKAVGECQEKLYEIKNSLENEKVLVKINTLKLEYDFDKKIAWQQLETQRAEFRHRLILMLVVLLLLVMTLLYVLVRFRNRRIRLQKKELERDLELRNNELTSNVMFLMKNVELVKEVVLRLTALKSNLKAENVEPVKEVIRDLQTLTRDDLWNEFEVRFNRVHLDFYKKLKVHCPELTPAELKLCAFLRLNMSTKEIGTLVGITDRSIDVMRARIRKKLNITNTSINLVTFLSDF